MRGPIVGHIRGWVALFATLMVPVPVGAQPAGWVVLGAGNDAQREGLAEWRARVEERLSAQGEPVIEGATIGERVRRELSAPFAPAPSELVRAIGDAVEPALYDVASGNTEAVRERALPLLERADAHLTALNLSPQVAKDLADLCYVVVRSSLVDGDDAAARAQVLSCRRRTTLAPAEDLHPPPVRRLFQEATQRIDAGEAARLTVQTPPNSAEGCSVLVNGQPVGRATRSVRVFAPEGRYAVGLVCAEGSAPQRLHHVELGQGTTKRIVIDPALDRAITGGDGILTYPDTELDPAAVHQHARTIGEAVGASGVLLVTISGGQVEVERIPTAARALVAADADEATVGDALAAVLAGRSFRAGAAHDDATSTASSGGRPIVGPALLAVAGLAGVGVALGSILMAGCVEQDAAGNCTVEDELQVLPTAIYGAAGGVALGAAVLWFLLGGGDDVESPPGTARVDIGFGSVDVQVRF